MINVKDTTGHPLIENERNQFGPLDTAPKDGTSIDVLCKCETGEWVVPNLHYAHAPMDKTVMILWGNNNFLSPYFTPEGWRLAKND